MKHPLKNSEVFCNLSSETFASSIATFDQSVVGEAAMSPFERRLMRSLLRILNVLVRIVIGLGALQDVRY